MMETAAFHPVAAEAVARILSVAQPDRVLLFGSWARGEAGPDSDLDLLVVMPFEGPRHSAVLPLLHELADLPVPKDVVVLTPEEWARKKTVPGTIAYPAAHEGVTLYER